jgi:NhaP-type Na+/H+ or K+/H+ antiporter
MEFNLALLTLSGLVILLGSFSSVLKQRLFLSEPIVALLVGVILGPLVSGAVNLSDWGNPNVILEQGARLAIAIQLIGAALRLPPGYPFRQWRTLAGLLGLVMPLMWLISGLLVYLILGLPFWTAMLIGAILTPTDPVVATSVVTGKVAEQNLPGHLRNPLSAESAANDGLGFPFVLLPILIMTRSPGDAVLHWLGYVVLWQVVGAVLIGGLIGYGAGKLLLWAEAKKTVDKQSFLAYTVALAILVLAVLKLLDTDGILAVYAAGTIFTIIVNGHERAETGKVDEAIDRFFTLFIFVLLGLALPWQEWLNLGWKGIGLAIAIILLRRPPVLLLCRSALPQLKGLKPALFAGWFGPIGVSALFYAMLAMEKTGLEEIWPISSLVICVSILVYGTTAIPLTKFYGQTAHDRDR